MTVKEVTPVNNKPGKPEVTYARFIHQIALTNILLVSVAAKSSDEGLALSCAGGDITVNVKDKARFINDKEQIKVFHVYTSTIQDHKSSKVIGKVICEFMVTYSSKIGLDEEIFKTFSKTSLHLTTWPYMRELVHNLSTRMGCPLVAPVVKGFTKPGQSN